jgi:hypothetical protein
MLAVERKGEIEYRFGMTSQRGLLRQARRIANAKISF